MNRKNFTTISIITFFVFIIFFTPHMASSKSPVILEGLYATSVNSNYTKYGPEKLFDGKDTYWATMPGAAPDEGVMLYFEKKTYIGKLGLELPSVSNLNRIKKIKIYANGVDRGVINVEKQARINKMVKSLYIRIVDTSGVVSSSVKSDIKDFTKQHVAYKSSEPTGISEVHLYDKNGKKLNIIPPRVITGKVIASSTLPPEEAYSIDYLFDSKLDSGWVEGKKGSGAGSSIKFIFDKNIKISKIKIWNGMLMSRKHYIANERVKNFSFGITGSTGQKYNLPDSMKPQVVTLKKPLKGKSFQLKIDNVYRGTAYKDCVITEFRFFSKGQWFMVNTGKAEMRKKSNINRIKNTVMQNVVDKLLRVKYEGDLGIKSQSIILRSNNSFVIWIENEESDYGKSSYNKKVLDGFWDIRSLTNKSAKVRLLGKVFKISEEFEMYKNDKKSERVAIFSDILDVRKSSITGKKQMGKITY